MTTRVGRTLLAIGLVLTLGSGCTPGEAPATPTASPSVEPTATQVEPSHTATVTTTPTITPSLRPSRTPTPQPTNTPSPPPQIVCSYPIDGDQSIGPDRPLILEFDRPMNPDSVAAHLTISPTVQGTIDWPSPQRLVYTPAQPWQDGKTYELCLAPETADTHGVALGKPFHLRFSRGGRGVPIPVLMYHNLGELDESATEGKRTWTVSPDAFAAQMTYLVDTGWHSISPQQMADYFDSGAPLPPKSIIISMDDGYKEVYTVAYPIFVKTGLRPLLFIVLKYVGFPAYLDWPQLEELVAHDFIIGSHTYDHSNLRKVDDDALEEQIGGSKDQLVERLGITIEAFCYPYGSYDERTLAALEAHGYRTAFTLNPSAFQSPGDPYRINRLRVSYDMTLEDFIALLP